MTHHETGEYYLRKEPLEKPELQDVISDYQTINNHKLQNRREEKHV